MKIVAVIVTFNRLDKLKKTLQCYSKQTLSFDSLVVVNNNSNDGTFEFLHEWKQVDAPFLKHVVNLSENIGGSGGFYEGEKYALSLKPDWICVADDDAYPSINYIEAFTKFINENTDKKIAAVSSLVKDVDGKVDFAHRSSIVNTPIWGYPRVNSTPDDYKKDFFEINLFSYVGTFINVKSLEEVGLCNRELFIYADDAEHSYRISKTGHIFCVPSLVVVHDSGQKAEIIENKQKLTWRDYYSIRNQINLFKKYNLLAAFYFAFLSINGARKSKTSGIKLAITAIVHGFIGHLGIHPLYKPGFKI